MAYNTCAKNLCKRTVLVQFIIKNVITCFLEHSVVGCMAVVERWSFNLPFPAVDQQLTSDHLCG